ncbi:MAG: DUF5597 domain-containing protein [Ferruginibacter sp.]
MKKVYAISGILIIATSLFAQKIAIPHLEKKGNITRLIVKGKPLLVLGGELHNSSTSGADYMRPVWQQMKLKNVNTVMAPVYWELLEPQEGKFDFSLVDSMIYGARKQQLHLCILWFASWKNGYSMYAPGWVKTNPEKYARVKNKQGEPFAILSALSDAAMKADAKAFKILLQHIRQADEKYQTVIMAQVENEVGLFYEPLDYNDQGRKAYEQGVPADLMQYLTANKNTLQPELDSAWKANGYKTTGSWEDVFGKSMLDKEHWKALSYLPEELFTVYHYSKYIGRVAAAGKEAYPIPMYVNAWIKQSGFGSPGKYPSGGPVPHTLDIWKATAPAIDFIAPDIYVPIPEARYTIEQYHRTGNPVFIPEFRPGAASASLAFWVFGRHDAICFAPFGIDETTPQEDPITKSYAALSQVSDLILQHQGKGTMAGIYLDTTDKSQSFELNGYQVKANLNLPSSGPAGGIVAGLLSSDNKVTSAGGIVFATGPDEFLIVGKDFTLSFTPTKNEANKIKIDVEYSDDGSFVNGKWKTRRRLNGDEGTGGGDYGFGFNKGFSALFKFSTSSNGNYSIVRFKVYKY